MVSKELLSEVFGWDIKFVNPRVNDNEISFVDYNGNVDSFNVYYVAHKCKEWALGKGYTLSTSYQGVCYINLTIENNIYKYDKKITMETEPEAIFKACQWIYNNKEN